MRLGLQYQSVCLWIKSTVFQNRAIDNFMATNLRTADDLIEIIFLQSP
jgi:hypothetical protein